MTETIFGIAFVVALLVVYALWSVSPWDDGGVFPPEGEDE